MDHLLPQCCRVTNVQPPTASDQAACRERVELLLRLRVCDSQNHYCNHAETLCVT